MTNSGIRRLRLRHQQLIDRSFTAPADVVRWFGALQSQGLASCLYAVGLRMQGATEALVERAIADRSIVRSWPMRRTLHCMPGEDARWMVRLLAPRQNVRMNSYYRKAGITHDGLERAGKVLLSALVGGKQLTRSELYQELNGAGIATTAVAGAMRGLHILVHWAQAGLICLASRKGKQQTFALLDEWAPAGRNLSGDEALAEMAKRYFRSHGPATERDFAWWAGLTMAEARQGLRLIADSVESVTVLGVKYWLMRGARAPSQRQKNSVLLLPAFDEYTVAYADRTAVSDEAMLRQMSHGISSNIVIDGRIAGTWKRRLSNNTVGVSYRLLRRLTRYEQDGLTRAIEEYGRFIGRKVAGPAGTGRPAPRH
jgi:hypothetical protein